MKKHKNSSRDKIEFECLKIWSCHTFKQPDLDTMLKVITLHEQKKIDCFSVDGYCNHSETVLKAMVCYFRFYPFQ